MPSAVTGLTPTSGTNTGASMTAATKSMGKDDFLKLLLAQLQNQDPTAPTDNTQFVAQLAQFSSLEQAEQTNSTLESLLLAQASANQTSAASFIGKSVLFKSTGVTLGSSGATILGTLNQNASTVTATIQDANGKTVRTITLKDVTSGALSVPWDGKSDDGTKLPNGAYTVNLAAKDAKGNNLTISTQGRATVTGVDFSSGAAQLIVNGQTINMSDVIEITQPTSG
jgi:flagellar basal-body rod modification protein FlgD